MTDTANLALPCIEGSQAQKHVTHNESLRVLDTLVQLAVLDRDLTAPPGSPAEGQRWIVKTGATGAWAAHVDAIAAWQDGAWQFSTPRVGWLAYVVDESLLAAWNGSAWVSAIAALTPTALNNMTLLGVGTTADSTNLLSAKLNNALFAAKTVAEGGDGNLRYKLSKESTAKTLSFLFQDNFSGRAEIGLTGDDDFHFKVSPDGATWREAIVISKTTGQVSFPQGSASSDLELTLAELSLGVADALNTAQFLGSSGNRFADSFDALTFVNTGAATNLDTGTAGLLKPSASSGSAISGATGSNIGNMSANGGLAAAFDGTTSQDNSASAATASGDSGYVGKNYSGVGGKKIGQAIVYPSNLSGFYTTINPTVTITLYGKASAPSSETDGTVIGTASAADSTSPMTVISTDLTTTWNYVWARVSGGSGGNQAYIAECIFYLAGATNNLTVTSTALTASSAPGSAKLVARVKEIDAITLNTDLVFSVSRDGGTTWTAFAMTRKFTANSIAVYDSDNLDISGQPTGTSMKWKAASANSKSFELHDVYLYWS